MRANLLMTKGMDRANFIGLTDVCMMECGKMESNMVKAGLLLRIQLKGLESGKKAEKLDG